MLKALFIHPIKASQRMKSYYQLPPDFPLMNKIFIISGHTAPTMYRKLADGYVKNVFQHDALRKMIEKLGGTNMRAYDAARNIRSKILTCHEIYVIADQEQLDPNSGVEKTAMVKLANEKNIEFAREGSSESIKLLTEHDFVVWLAGGTLGIDLVNELYSEKKNDSAKKNGKE